MKYPANIAFVSTQFEGMAFPFFTCIQKAIDSLYISDIIYPANKCVHVNPGTYRLAAPIVLKNGVSIVWSEGVELIPLYGDGIEEEFFNDDGKSICIGWTGMPYMSNVNQGHEFNLTSGTYFYNGLWKQENFSDVSPADLEVPYSYENLSPENKLINMVLTLGGSADAVTVTIETDMVVLFELDYPIGFVGDIPVSFILQSGGTLTITSTGATPAVIKSLIEIGNLVIEHLPVVP